VMSRTFFDYQHTPDGPFPDISQLVTARLRPHQTRRVTHAQQIAQHEAEIRRLSDLAAAIEQAVTALIIRIHATMDQRQREALEHSRADLQRFKDELESVQTEHQHAIERLQPQQPLLRLDRQ
jgi:hypothetical protein